MDIRNILGKLDQLNEGTMAQAKAKPTGPKFGKGKWKGTDPASAAKDKYVGGESILRDLESKLNEDPVKRDLSKEFRAFKEAYDHNAPFNAADFNRHMEQLRAREELRKTDPMRALVGDLIDKDNAARNAKKKPQDDDSMSTSDPRHPQYAYTQAGQQGVAEDESQPVKYRATVEYGPTAADAHFVTVTASSTEEAEAKVEAWCKKKGVRNPMITINGADRPMDEGWKDKLAGGAMAIGALGGIGALQNVAPNVTVQGHQFQLANPGTQPADAKLVTTDDGKKVYVWKTTGHKNRVSWSYRPAEQVKEQEVEESPEEALKYATQAHAGQTRSGGDPYISHPVRVANHIKQYKQSHNLDALISAAYLHDTIEDTDTTHEALHDLFGGLVASLVKELTSDPEQIKKMGKAAYLSHKMAAMSSYALVIKLADRLDNVKDITTARTPQWRAKYAAETNQILNYIEKNRALSSTHNKLISLIRAKLAEINNPQQGVAEDVDVDTHWIPDVVRLLGKLVASSKAQAKYNVEPEDIPDVKEFINLLSTGNLDAAKDHWSMMEWNDLDNALEYFVRKNGLPHIWLHKLLGEQEVDEGYGEDDGIHIGAKVYHKEHQSGEPFEVVKILDDQRVGVIDDYGNKKAMFIDQLVPAQGLKEFAPSSDDSDGNDDVLFQFAQMWYSAPNVAIQQRVEQALAKAGWEIGELESEEGGAYVMRIGDEAGNSYIGWSEEQLADIREDISRRGFSELDLAVMEGGHELIKEAPVAPVQPGAAPAPAAGKPTLGADLTKPAAQQAAQQQQKTQQAQQAAAQKEKLQQASLTKGVNSLKSAGAAVSNPNQVVKAFDKAENNQGLTPADKNSIASAGTVLAPIMANPQLQGKFKDLVTQASAEQMKAQQQAKQQQTQAAGAPVAGQVK